MIRQFLLIISFLGAIFSCKKQEVGILPKKEDITEAVYASGIVKTNNQFQVFPTSSGIIREIYVSEGATVKKGEPLLKVLNEAIQYNVDNAVLAQEQALENLRGEKLLELKTAIELARIKLENDSVLLERQRRLWAQQIGSQLELEQRTLAYDNSVAALRTAEYRYQDAKKQLSYSAKQAQNNVNLSRQQQKDYILKSEKPGVVYSILKKEGEMVTLQTPVAIMGDPSGFIIELQVDEYDITSIALGQKVFITMDSYKGSLFEAEVVKINSIMNERSRSFKVEAVFTKQPKVLYPNLTVEANIVIHKKEDALTIPRNYLVDNEYVIIADGKKVKVATGLKDYDKVEIISGLSADTKIFLPK